MTVTTQQAKGTLFPAVLLVLGGLLLLFSEGKISIDILPPKPNPDAWLIFVDQFEDREGPYATLVNSAEFKSTIAEKKVTYRHWDVDQPEGKSIADATKLQIPFYAIANPIEGEGKTELKIVASGAAPTTLDEANTLIKKWIGK